MAMLPVTATTGISTFRLFPALSRTLQILCQELSRGFAAAHRYEELKIGQASASRLRDRGGKARQVFVDMYADQ